MGQTLASSLGARVCGDQFIRAGVQPHLLAAAADLQGLASQAERRRVEGLLKHHIAIMFGTFTVASLDLRVVEKGLSNAGIEVIEHDPAWHAAKESKRVAVERNPGRQALVEDELDVLMAAPRERHHEGPGLARLATGWVAHASSIAEVDLAFLTGGAFDPRGCLGRGGVQAVQKAVD